MKKFLAFLLASVMVLPLSACGGAKKQKHNQTESETYADYINYRGYNEDLVPNKYKGALANTYKKLNSNKELNVVYFGGSVTAGYGSEDDDLKGCWRVRIGDWLTKTFPEVKINNINCAIGETGTNLGLYRTKRDIIPLKPDLLFIEYSINDLYDSADYTRASTQFETIVRNVKEALPECDIVTILVTERSQAPSAHLGDLHTQARAHEDICNKYRISTIHVGRALADEIINKGDGLLLDEVWNEYVKDVVHPFNKGYAVYYEVIKEFMVNSLFFGDCKGCKIVKQALPEQVNDQLLDGDITFIDDDDKNITFTTDDGAKAEPDKSGITDGYKGIIHFPKGTSDTITVKFTGTDLVLIGRSGYTKDNFFEVSIDGGETWEKHNYAGKNPTPILKNLFSKEYTVIIKPAGNNDVSIDGFYSRNADKATKKPDSDVTYF